jgi:membrane-bound lytic murein transglycosylase D
MPVRIASLIAPARVVPALLLLALLFTSCAPAHYRATAGVRVPNAAMPDLGGSAARAPSGYVKDNKPSIWISQHPRVAQFYDYYSRTTTVETALTRSRRYMPIVVREFQQRGLPLELAYLPMLESMFVNTADSGSARGLWQFIPSTARRMGLKVGAFADERLNWHKATVAAAEYLDQLGQQFNYNWALALAAYNCGPGCVERAMQAQRSWDYFDLELRKETAEYVPRFLAMVQVAKEKYAHMLVAGR